jgi:TolB protein
MKRIPFRRVLTQLCVAVPTTLLTAAVLLAPARAWAEAVGAFEDHGDVGVTPKAGSVEYDAGARTYRITGGGANMWAATDAFQFVWKKVSGDVALSADVEFVGEGAVGHRKAAVIIRQSLDAGSAYADVALHGDGLTSLQYRPTAGAETLEARSELKGPKRLRIERRGNEFTMWVGEPGGTLTRGGPVTVALSDPVYIGLAVYSHDASVLETAVFSNVQIEEPLRPILRSNVSVYDLATKRVEVVYTADQRIEAPNWSPDGSYLLVNSLGDLWKLPLGNTPAVLERIPLSLPVRCNNDHGISPDGKMLAISASTGGGSQIYTANSDGSNMKLIAAKMPSYFHGMSPDGKWLAYTAQRNGDFDLHRIPTAGGEEERLNRADGLDDGPHYSPDGKWIYLNSIRTGNFDIWRIPADGAGPGDAKAQQVTNDEWEDWFAHPSPDSKWMVLISFEKGTEGHPQNKNVRLRLMPLPGDNPGPGHPETIVELFGGQGTINVNSWSPDSKKFAFVSYELLNND